MKAFFDPVQAEHAPQFFLQRGVVRQHFEVPARAEALPAFRQAPAADGLAAPVVLTH